MHDKRDSNVAEADNDAHSLRELSLLDAEPPKAFHAITRLATRIFRTEVALISIIDEESDRQFFSSQRGLCEPFATQRQTPLSHSFCQHVKNGSGPLVVPDARKHPLFKRNPAIKDLGVIAYLGVPVHGPDGAKIGALCVISDQRRKWTENDVSVLGDLAACVDDEIVLRASLMEAAARQERIERYNALRETITLAFMAPDLSVPDRFDELLRAGCEALGFDTGMITRVDGGSASVQFSHGVRIANLPPSRLVFAGSLSNSVATGQSQLCYHDLAHSNMNGRHLLTGAVPGCFVGTPLISDGILHGTLEFSSRTPRIEPFSEEELSMLSIISMFACAQLGVFGQITSLKKSEAALLQYLIDSKYAEKQFGCAS